ncbi:hypothetical protein ABEB36_006471 [Hypothenemus hampei]|uniref:CHK kinase-like domain-containing protein n=1 Tax=Hypothenemus hampei TaxID=57062 RepID=A0ABD1EQN0_HYPHA
MCATKTEDDLNLWIEDFLKKRRYSKYELELTGNSSKADGYLGEVTFVKVLTGIGREEEKIYNLVVKSAKKSAELRRQTPIKDVFEREMFMYSKVFPAFKAFQQEHHLERPFMKFAKCYSVFNENQREAIILQNLKYLEFNVHDRKTSQDLEHVLLTFSNYGKLHALSLAMKKQKPKIYDNLTRNMTDLLAKFIVQANMLDVMSELFRDCLDLIKNDADKSVYKKLEYFKEREELEKALHKIPNPSDGFSVILHGDCWNNNMMYYYNENSNGTPQDIMFLDFQLSSVASPIYDLSYYLYAVADGEVLKHFDLILETYLTSLNGFLDELQETSYNITMEDLKRHWREYGKFGLAMCPFILKIELSEEEEVVDFAESAEAGNIAATLTTELKHREVFNTRLRAVFKHYASLL